MTIALTYDGVLSRVRIEATAAPAGAEHIMVERSTDEITWTTVRGGTAVTLIAGEAHLDDYEFTPGVPNFYRVSFVDTGASTEVGLGAAATGNNATLNPALPASLQAGDLMTCLASIRATAATVGTPAGWTKIIDGGNVALLARRYVAGDTAPAVTFSGGAAGDDTLARIYARRNVELTPVTVTAVQSNASAQNVAFPGFTVPSDVDNPIAYAIAWKQDDWTSVALSAGWTAIADTSSTTGNDAAQAIARQVPVSPSTVAAGTFTITGGAAAISKGAAALFRGADYLIRESDDITPVITQVWLKSLAKPFLNRPVTVHAWTEVERPSRSGVFEVVGRSFPIVVAEVRGSKRWTLQIQVADQDAADEMDLVLASGDLQYVQVPLGSPVPHGYVVVGDTTQGWFFSHNGRQTFALPMTQVAAPTADVAGATITCQGVLNAYATCADVLADNATCADLLELIGDPSDVIVS